MAREHFFKVEQTAVKTSLGDVAFPIFYYEVDGLFASFWIDYERALDKLKGTGLLPAVRPGPLRRKALATIAFFEYSGCSAAPYNETAVAIHSYPAALGAKRTLSLRDLVGDAENHTVGTYITDLPVTTEWARAGGVELYGYPKWVADIPIDFGKTRFDGRVIDPATGDEVYRLAGRLRGLGFRLPAPQVMSYSLLDGKMLKTAIKTDGYHKHYLGSGLRLEAGASRHRAAENIRALGLDGAVPFAVQRTAHFRVILPLGKPIG